MAAVLFDLFETLITETGTDPTRASSLGPILGLSDASFRVEWKRYRRLVLLGERSLHQTLSDIAASLSQGADEEAIAAVCRTRKSEKAALFEFVDRDIVAMVRALSGRGHRLAVLSNCFAEDVAAWSTCALAGEFSCTAFSHEVGAAKPDPEIYRYAVRQLEAEPGAAVFIGDGGDHELEGAERAGIASYRAAWFSDVSTPDTAPHPELRRCSDVLDLLSTV